jgi:hypothetical protein
LSGLKTQDPNEPLTPEMKSTLDEFFGENGTQANQILELYLQALSQINSTPDSPDPEAENFVLSFNETLLYLTKRLGKRSFADYEESIKALFKEIDNRVVAIFNSTYITGLPPKGIQNVKDLLGIWSKFDVSLQHTSEFKSFIEAMSLNGTPVDESITENYFQTFMKQYADMAKPVGPHVFGYGYPQEEVDAALAAENFWIHYFINRLKGYNLDELWEDGAIIGVFDMISQGVIDLGKEDPAVQQSIVEALNTFAINNIKLSDIKQAKATMREIISDYKGEKITDAKTLERFAEAYQKVYVYELLYGKNADDSLVLDKETLFVLMQSEAYMTCKDFKKINPNLLIKRAIQDYTIKKSRDEFYEKFNGTVRSRVLPVIEEDAQYADNRLGAAFGPAQLVSISIPIQNGDVVSTICHEIEHVIEDGQLMRGECNDFDAYAARQDNVALSRLGIRASVKIQSVHKESRAEIMGALGQLQAMKVLLAGKNSKKKVESEEAIALKILPHMMTLMKSTVVIQKDGKKYAYKSTSINDAVAKDIAKKEGFNSKENDIYLFEYKKDGTPKTFEEILQDQEFEMDISKNYITSKGFPFGPQTVQDRLNLRMKIMLRRAIAEHKEEEFAKTMNDFLKKHYDELSADPLFKIGFPGGKFPDEKQAAIALVTFLDAENRNAFGNAEALAGVLMVAQQIEKGKGKTNPASGGSVPDDQETE